MTRSELETNQALYAISNVATTLVASDSAQLASWALPPIFSIRRDWVWNARISSPPHTNEETVDGICWGSLRSGIGKKILTNGAHEQPYGKHDDFPVIRPQGPCSPNDDRITRYILKNGNISFGC